MFPFTFPSGSLPDEIGLFIPLALLIGVFAILLVRRRDAGAGDDRGARYVGMISLVTLFVALFAAFIAVNALTDLMVDHETRAEINQKAIESPDYPTFYPGTGPGGAVTSLSVDPGGLYTYNRDNNGNYDTAVASGLAALTAGAVFIYHRRRRGEIMQAKGAASSGAAVVNHAYLQSVKAVAALTVALAGAAALYGVWHLLAPGIAGSLDADVGRAEGISTFLSSGLLTVAAGLIFVRAENELGSN